MMVEEDTGQCEKIHRMLDRLPLYSYLSSNLPLNGLYFFYENGETCPHTSKPRIVRVGNHPRSRDGLVRRLKQHYGSNKNSSVFRKFLGGAILRRKDPNHPCLQPSPGKGHWEKQHAKTCEICKPLEREVTEYLMNNFWFRCIEICNREERNEMEKKLVATLARCPECKPSKGWLGLRAYSGKVNDSGMWNSKHVNSEHEMTPLDVEKLKNYIRGSI